MSHQVTVEQMTQEEMIGYLSARADDHVAGFHISPESAEEYVQQSHAEAIRRVNEEAKDFDAEGGWLAYCECGWKGNNPHPGKQAAQEAVDYHLSTVEENADG